MIIENKTAMFQKCGGVVARPWRRIVVPDNVTVDLNRFEIIEEAYKPQTKNKKEKSE